MTALPAWKAIPEHLRGGLARYLIYGIQPGSGLSAIIKGDLFETLKLVSEDTCKGLIHIVTFLENYAPSGSLGSHADLLGWICLSTNARITATRRAAGDAFEQMVSDSGVPLPSEEIE